MLRTRLIAHSFGKRLGFWFGVAWFSEELLLAAEIVVSGTHGDGRQDEGCERDEEDGLHVASLSVCLGCRCSF